MGIDGYTINRDDSPDLADAIRAPFDSKMVGYATVQDGFGSYDTGRLTIHHKRSGPITICGMQIDCLGRWFHSDQLNAMELDTVEKFCKKCFIH